MTVNNTTAMQVLLEALCIKFEVIDDYIKLLCDKSELMYAINSTEEDIQAIYGLSREWKELCKLYQ